MRSTSTIAGLGPALRISARRSRWYWIIWILALVGLMPATVGAYSELVPPGPEGQVMLNALQADPTMRAILGVPHDLTTKGGFAFWRVGSFTAWAAGAMAGWGVIRLTRAEEDAGRAELVRAGAIGRHAQLVAALVLAVAASTVLGVLSALGMIASGAPATGSVAAGASIATMGWFFAGVGAVCAQIFDNSRTATSWCVGILLGGLYVVRAFIDARSDGEVAAMWVVPLEWASMVRPYADERWWVLALPVVCGFVAMGVALRLESVRDHGAGLRTTRLGRAHAPGWLSGAHGLAWRQHRVGVVAWTLSMLVAGVMVGSIAAQMDDIIAQNPQFAELVRRMGGGGETLTLSFLSAMLTLLGVVAAMSSVQFLGTARAEEPPGRTELMLSTATSRHTYLASHVIYALVVGSVLLVALGFVIPLPQAFEGGSLDLSGDFGRGALALLPGLWLIVGIGCLFIGWAPRLVGLTWAVAGWSLFCSWFGAILQLPDWLIEVEPFGYLPRLPIDEMAWTPVLVETALAAALIVAGFIGYRRRNIPAL